MGAIHPNLRLVAVEHDAGRPTTNTRRSNSRLYRSQPGTSGARRTRLAEREPATPGTDRRGRAGDPGAADSWCGRKVREQRDPERADDAADEAAGGADHRRLGT